MRIEIFVVKTEKPNKKELKKCLTSLLKVFNGLTVIPNCKGFWINTSDIFDNKTYVDKVEIWLIYTQKFEKFERNALIQILNKIKQVTKQKCQAFTLNNQIYFI